MNEKIYFQSLDIARTIQKEKGVKNHSIFKI